VLRGGRKSGELVVVDLSEWEGGRARLPDELQRGMMGETGSGTENGGGFRNLLSGKTSERKKPEERKDGQSPNRLFFRKRLGR